MKPGRGGQVVLAVDQGTTGTAVLAVTAEGAVAGQAHAEHEQHFPAPGRVEHDGEEIWRNVARLLHEALAAAGRSATDVVAIGITNQRETTLLWERATGKLVAPAVVWQDRRSTAICERLVAGGAAQLVAERTGLVIDPYFSATKLAWWFEHDPDLARRAEAGELCAGTVDSFLLHRLSGGRLHVTDVTNASRTLLMALDRASWDHELCKLFGVPAAVLPEIVPSVGVIGETAPLAGALRETAGGAVEVPGGLLLAGVLGDQQASLFAHGCRRPGQAKNTYGTGSFVLANTGAQRPATDGSLLATAAVAVAPGAGGGGGGGGGGRAGESSGRAGAPALQYALEGAIFATGSAVQWLRDGLGVVATAAETEGLAASVPDTGDVYFVPALAGLGAPWWDPAARGTLVGVTRGTTRAHLARAVLESIAYRTRDVLEAMARNGRPVHELRVDGGASANNWLMQFQADVAQVPVDVSAVAETTSLGAAFAAGLGAGWWQDRDELEQLRASRAVFEPRWSAGEAASRYRRWLQALDRSRRWAGDD